MNNTDEAFQEVQTHVSREIRIAVDEFRRKDGNSEFRLPDDFERILSARLWDFVANKVQPVFIRAEVSLDVAREMKFNPSSVQKILEDLIVDLRILVESFRPLTKPKGDKTHVEK